MEYRAIIEVMAVQWNGNNLDEMKELLKDVVESDEDGLFVYVDEIEPFFYASRVDGKVIIDNPGYNMLKFEAWGDDQEVDPGQWVVVYEDGEGEIMDDQQFTKMGFVKK